MRRSSDMYLLNYAHDPRHFVVYVALGPNTAPVTTYHTLVLNRTTSSSQDGYCAVYRIALLQLLRYAADRPSRVHMVQTLCQ